MATARPRTQPKGSSLRFFRAPAPPKTKAHPIPPLGYVLITLVVIQWFHATSLAVKIQCVVGAALFSCTEYAFYTMTIEEPDGTVVVRPFAGRPGHTTVHQYIMNVLYIPVLIHGFHAFISSTFLRILLFPLNIWLLEIIQGYTLIYLIGYNAAWSYRGYDAFFHGNIKLWYVHHWLMMGAALELVILPYVLPFTYTIADALVQKIAFK